MAGNYLMHTSGYVSDKPTSSSNGVFTWTKTDRDTDTDSYNMQESYTGTNTYSDTDVQ